MIKDQEFYPTNSSTQALLRCNQEFLFDYQHGLTPATPPIYYVTGEAAHKAMECFLRTSGKSKQPMIVRNPARAIEDMHNSLDEVYKQHNASDELISSRNQITILFNALGRRFQDTFENWSVLATELQPDIKDKRALGTGKIDAIIQENDTGDVYVVELKTTRGIQSRKIASLSMDYQCLYYLTLVNNCRDKALQKYLPIKKIMYVILVKPKHKRFADREKAVEENSNNYIAFQPTFVTETNLSEATADHLQINQRAHDVLNGKIRPHRNTTNCVNAFGLTCRFLYLCESGFRAETATTQELIEADFGGNMYEREVYHLELQKSAKRRKAQGEVGQSDTF